MKRIIRNLFISCLTVFSLLGVNMPAHATTATGNYVCDNSTLAGFPSWAGAIHSAFISFGWVQTSDTGQTIPSAAAAVPSSNYLYVIYKSNDALSSTLPIYVKFEYGFSSTSPRIRFTVGTSSNGSGTITGSTISPSAVGTVSGNSWEVTNALEANLGSLTTFPSFFSGDAGNFRMYMWQSNITRSGVLFEIARSVDTTGSYTGEYFTVLYANDRNADFNTLGEQQTISSTYVYPEESAIIGVAITTNSGTGAANGIVGAYPVFPTMGKVGNPLMDLMFVAQGDVTSGATVTVASMYGTTHTYIAVSSNQTTGGFARVGQKGENGAPMAILMRYE